MIQNAEWFFPSAAAAINHAIARAITMTKADLIKRLGELKDDGDVEANHKEADRLLMDFINDPDITAAFDDVRKWYA